ECKGYHPKHDPQEENTLPEMKYCTPFRSLPEKNERNNHTRTGSGAVLWYYGVGSRENPPRTQHTARKPTTNKQTHGGGTITTTRTCVPRHACAPQSTR